MGMSYELNGSNEAENTKENSEPKLNAVDDIKEKDKQNEGETKTITDLKDEVPAKDEVPEKVESKSDAPPENSLENMAAPEIVYDVNDDIPVAIVTGEPYKIGKKLDYKQGDNPYNAQGNCGLVSITNLLRMAGLNVTENDVTKFALDNHLCSNPQFGRDGDRGGTTPEQRIQILKAFGVEAKSSYYMSVNDIADAVEQGKGVLMSVNAGYLWNEPAYVKDPMGRIHSNHCIAVTSVARDPVSGNVLGLYICDSGRGEKSDSSRFVSVDELNRCYTGVQGTSVQITNNPIR